MCLKKRDGNWASPRSGACCSVSPSRCRFNYRFAEAHPDSVRGVAGLCGGLPGNWDDEHPGRIRAAVLHIARSQDEFYTAERTEQYARRLRLRCDEVEFHLLEGGHRFPSGAGPIWENWLNRILG
jgi:dienelactone hydrolase